MSKRDIILILVFTLCIFLGFFIYQSILYKRSLKRINGTISYTEDCIRSIYNCYGLKNRKQNLEEYISKLMPKVSNKVKTSEEYIRLNEDLWPKAQSGLAFVEKREAAENELLNALESLRITIDEVEAEKAEAERKFKREYELLGPPKLLFSCNDEIAYVAGKGLSNFNSIYLNAKEECGANGRFEIIDSEK